MFESSFLPLKFNQMDRYKVSFLILFITYGEG